MWIRDRVLAAVVKVVRVVTRVGRRGGSLGESRDESPGTVGGRASREAAWVAAGRVALVAVLCAVVGMPQPAAAAGSYGAVVEKGLRGCTTDPESGIVICFESPTLSPRSRLQFLGAWRAAHFRFSAWGVRPTTVSVRAVAVSAEGSLPGRPVLLTYVTAADTVMPGLTCTAELSFGASGGVLRVQNLVTFCPA